MRLYTHYVRIYSCAVYTRVHAHTLRACVYTHIRVKGVREAIKELRKRAEEEIVIPSFSLRSSHNYGENPRKNTLLDRLLGFGILVWDFTYLTGLWKERTRRQGNR